MQSTQLSEEIIKKVSTAINEISSVQNQIVTNVDLIIEKNPDPSSPEQELKSLRQSIVKASKDYQCKFMDKVEPMTEIQVKCAKQVCTDFEAFSDELMVLIKCAEEAFYDVQEKIKEGFNPAKPLLSRAQEEYLAKIQIDTPTLYTMLDQEKVHWDTELAQKE